MGVDGVGALGGAYRTFPRSSRFASFTCAKAALACLAVSYASSSVSDAFGVSLINDLAS